MSGTLQSEKIGPVDVAVISFEGGEFNGDVAPALSDLQASGTVQVIDLAFVRKDADGVTSIIEARRRGCLRGVQPDHRVAI